jgi:hypothetical protein
MSRKINRLRRYQQVPARRYGWVTITYARLNANGLTIGWSCRYGFGELSFRQNFQAEPVEGIPTGAPGSYTYTPLPGFYMDTEAMGAQFVGEVMKAYFWACERGDTIPESYAARANEPTN